MVDKVDSSVVDSVFGVSVTEVVAVVSVVFGFVIDVRVVVFDDVSVRVLVEGFVDSVGVVVCIDTVGVVGFDVVIVVDSSSGVSPGWGVVVVKLDLGTVIVTFSFVYILPIDTFSVVNGVVNTVGVLFVVNTT